MQHPDEETIHAWIDGALSDDEANAIERHVAECPACAEQVAEARGMIAGASRIVSSLDVARGNVIPRSPALASTSLWRRLHLTPVRAALAASVLLAVGSMLAVRDGGLGGSTTQRLGGSAARRLGDSATSVWAPAPVPAAAPTPSRETRPVQDVVANGTPEHPAKPLLNSNTISGPDVIVSAPTQQRAVAARRPVIDTQRPIDAMSTVSPAAPPAVVAGAQASQPAAQRAEAKSAGIAGSVLAERRAMDLSQPSQALAGARKLSNAVDAAQVAPICYQIERDTASWLRSIPPRFSLARDTATNRNVVRAVGPSSKLDSIVPGSDWTAPSASSYRVLLPTDRPNQPVSLLLTNDATAQATWGSEVRQLAVRHSLCPR